MLISLSNAIILLTTEKLFTIAQMFSFWSLESFQEPQGKRVWAFAHLMDQIFNTDPLLGRDYSLSNSSIYSLYPFRLVCLFVCLRVRPGTVFLEQLFALLKSETVIHYRILLLTKVLFHFLYVLCRALKTTICVSVFPLFIIWWHKTVCVRCYCSGRQKQKSEIINKN